MNVAIYGMAHCGTSLLYIMLMTTVVSHAFLPHEKWHDHHPVDRPTVFKEASQLWRGLGWDRPIVCIRDPRRLVATHHYADAGHLERQWAIVKQFKHPVFVRYEELVTDPDLIQEELEIEYPQLKFDGRFSQYLERQDRIVGREFFEKPMGGIRPLDEGGQERGQAPLWLLREMGYA